MTHACGVRTNKLARTAQRAPEIPRAGQSPVALHTYRQVLRRAIATSVRSTTTSLLRDGSSQPWRNNAGPGVLVDMVTGGSTRFYAPTNKLGMHLRRPGDHASIIHSPSLQSPLNKQQYTQWCLVAGASGGERKLIGNAWWTNV